VLIQYCGFQAQSYGRDYVYRVIDRASESREFTLTISNRAFTDRRLPYQAAADLCYQKLQKALDLESPEQPLSLHLTLSDQDLDEYREKHRPAKGRSW
jgi:hypothetical protein